SDGRLLLQEIAKNSNQTETKELQNQMEGLFRKIMDKMPYKGIVLSRNGQRVTVNIGSRDGIKRGDQLSAILITNSKRHPKYGFGSYSSSTDLAVPSMSYQAKSSLFPSISASGELWLTSNWTISALMQQSVITVSNPRVGSTPDKLNIGLSKYALFVGYSFLI